MSDKSSKISRIIIENHKKNAISQIGINENRDYFGFLKTKVKKRYFLDNDLEEMKV